MSIKQKALSLVKNPENDHISKFRVLGISTAVIGILSCLATFLLQDKKKNYFEEQNAQTQQKRSQASDAPMASLGTGHETNTYVVNQTKLKNQTAAYANNAMYTDSSTGNDHIQMPAIVATNTPQKKASEVKSQAKPVEVQPSGQLVTDPIIQELQNEKLDSIKHRYAAHRADTFLSLQPINASHPVKTTVPDNSQNIPSPAKLSDSETPSDGFVKTATKDQLEKSTTNDQNRQGEKSNFLTKKAQELFNEDYVNSTEKDPISKYEIKAGTPLPAFLITPINSDLPGMITAQIARNIYDTRTGNHLLIPGGSKLIGVYDSNITYGQSRVMVAWNRVIFPSGVSYRLYGMPGTDAMGVSGLTGEVNNHYGRIYGSAFVMGVITAGMQYSQNNANTNAQAGASYQNPTVGQSLAAGLGQQLGQAGLQVTQKNLNVQPTIEISQSQQINIMLTADVVLRPKSKKAYTGNTVIRKKDK